MIRRQLLLAPVASPLTVRARRQFLKSLALQVLRLHLLPPLVPFLGSAARRFLACQCLNFPAPRRRPPEPLAIAAPPLPRPLPTPCRSERPYICPMCADVGADSLRTLLQLSPTALRESWLRQLDGLTAPAVKILSLEALLPITALQRSALEIADILQQRAQCQPDLPEDWLDADLQPVLLSEHATEALRWRLRDVLTAWDVPGMGLVTSVLIFTDGSFKPASNGGLRQCFFSLAARKFWERYLGHSAYSSVTAYWLGEEEESSSTAEQLALAWALVWALDRGVAFHAPIIFAYDTARPCRREPTLLFRRPVFQQLQPLSDSAWRPVPRFCTGM